MDNRELIDIILLSMQVAFVAMIFALPLAYAVAYLLARFEFRGKALLQALVMLPLVMQIFSCVLIQPLPRLMLFVVVHLQPWRVIRPAALSTL